MREMVAAVIPSLINSDRRAIPRSCSSVGARSSWRDETAVSMATYMIQNIANVNTKGNDLYHSQIQDIDLIRFSPSSVSHTPIDKGGQKVGPASYFFIFAAARRTASSLTFPV